MADIEHLRFLPDDPELRGGLESMTGPVPIGSPTQGLVDRLMPYTHDDSRDMVDRISRYGYGREIKMANAILNWYGYSVQRGDTTAQPFKNH